MTSPGPRVPLGTFVMRANDVHDVLASTSGGIFSLLARRCLATGGAVYGVAWNRDDWSAEYLRVEDESGLAKLRGSKYVKARIGDAIRRVKADLSEGRQVLFSGTPCLVSAVLSSVDSSTRDNLLAVQVLCHGSPEERQLKRFLRELEKGRGARVTDIRCRERQHVGRFRGDALVVKFSDGSEYVRPSYKNPFGRAFLKGLVLPEACLKCAFRGGRSCADICLGDSWGLEKGHSLVLAYTERGLDRLASLPARSCRVPYERACACNPSIEGEPAFDEESRRRFLALGDEAPFSSCVETVLGPAVTDGLMKRIRRRLFFRRRLSADNVVAVSTFGLQSLFSNYGSFLQHFALRTALNRLGYRSVRLSTPKDRVGGFYWGGRKFRRSCENFFRRIFGLKRKDPVLAPLASFKRDYLRLLGPCASGVKNGSVRLAVAGSDQVWTHLKSWQWLKTVPKGCRKLSYAASADWLRRENDQGWRAYATEALGDFKAISVREDAGVKALEGLKGVCPAVRVVDPTLLLSRSDYERLLPEDPIFERPTLFCYFVNKERAEQFRLDLYEAVAASLGADLKVLGIQGTENWVPESVRVSPLSPLDFLRCVRDSVAVLTNSFHGTVFASLFQRPFLSLFQEDRPGFHQNTRQEELASLLGLERRRISETETVQEIVGRIREQVAWADVEKRVRVSADESLRWLAERLAD